MRKRTFFLLATIVLLWGGALGQISSEEEEFSFAERLFKDRAYWLAIEQLRNFIRDHPTSEKTADARLLLARAYFENGSFEEASNAYLDFALKHPGDFREPEVRFKTAECLSLLGRYMEAGRAYLKMRTSFPTSDLAPRALLEAGANFQKAKNFERAAEAYRILIKEYEKSDLSDKARYELGLSLLAMGEVSEALVELKRIAESEKVPEEKPKALLTIGKIYLEQSDLTSAEDAFGRLEKSYPKAQATGESKLALAEWLYNKENFERSARVFKDALDLLPEGESKERTLLSLADAQRMSGQDLLAQDSYEEFLRIYPSSPYRPQAMIGLGLVYTNLNDLNRGASLFQEVIDLFPDSEEALRKLGDIYSKKGDHIQAIQQYEQYLKLAKDPEARDEVEFRIAEIYEKNLEWFDEAIDVYRRLVDRKGSKFAASSQLAIARCFEKKGEGRRAIREYQGFLDRFPDSELVPQAMDRIEYIRDFSTPDHQAAFQNLTEILTEHLRGRSDEESLYDLAQMCYEIRDYEGAASAFLAYLSRYQPGRRSADVQYRLAESYAKLARKRELEGDFEAAEKLQREAAAAHQIVVDRYSQSPWADDSAIFLIEHEISKSPDDSTGYRLLLDSYEVFQSAYPFSDHLDFALLRNADAYRGLGDLNRALHLYRKVEEEFPKSDFVDDAIFGRGMCQLSLGNLNSAEANFRRLLIEYPQTDLSDECRYQLGRIFLTEADYRSAASEFNKLLTQRPSARAAKTRTADFLFHVRFLLAESYYQLGNYDEAVDLYQQIMDKDRDGGVLRGLALALWRKGEREDALEKYDRFLKLHPEASGADTVMFERGQLLVELEREEEAVETFRRLVERFPTSLLLSKVKKSIAELLFSLTRYNEALLAYNSLPEMEDEDVYGGKAVTLFRLGRTKEAKKSVKEFQKRFKGSEEWLARFKLEEGMLHLSRGNYDDARDRFNEILKDFGGTEFSDDASFYIAESFLMGGDTDKAAKAFEAFIENYKESDYWPQANMRLGGIYYNLEELVEAARAYRRVWHEVEGQLAPDAMWNTILSYEALGLLDSAIQVARELVDKFPEYEKTPKVKVKIGLFLYELRSYREAIDQLRECFEFADDKTEAEIQFYIGDSYFKMGDYRRAIVEYLKVAHFNPAQTIWAATAEIWAARAYQKLGETEKAEDIYRRMITHYGAQSEWGRGAADELRKLEGELSH